MYDVYLDADTGKHAVVDVQGHLDDPGSFLLRVPQGRPDK